MSTTNRLRVTSSTSVQVEGADGKVSLVLSDATALEIEGHLTDVLRLIIEADRQLARLVGPGRPPGWLTV